MSGKNSKLINLVNISSKSGITNPKSSKYYNSGDEKFESFTEIRKFPAAKKNQSSVKIGQVK